MDVYSHAGVTRVLTDQEVFSAEYGLTDSARLEPEIRALVRELI